MITEVITTAAMSAGVLGGTWALLKFKLVPELKAELEAELFVATLEATPPSTATPAVESHGLVPLPIPRELNHHDLKK